MFIVFTFLPNYFLMPFIPPVSICIERVKILDLVLGRNSPQRVNPFLYICFHILLSFVGFTSTIDIEPNDVDSNQSNDVVSCGHKLKNPSLRTWIFWWEKVDSNHRSQRQQIYSLPPLAAREFSQI